MLITHHTLKMETPLSISTPPNKKPSQVVRRSFTAPPKSRSSPISPLQTQDAVAEGAETLFESHACRIVSFHTSTRSWRHQAANRGSDVLNEPVGILPWASATETTKSTGSLRIYRVRGSVAFLSSGNTLRPILAKSQCWCVDGQSKFVIPIGDHTYYRIELPNRCPEDSVTIEEFKGVLEKILKYEKTLCPFKRGFTVDLPEPPTTPVRLRPWKPRVPSFTQSGSPGTKPYTSLMRRTDELDFEDLESVEPSSGEALTETLRHVEVEYNDIDHEGADRSKNVIVSGYTRDPGEDFSGNAGTGHKKTPMTETTARATKIEVGRTVTVPPHLLFQKKPSPDTATSILPPPPPNLETESISLSSSADSFYSFHSPISPLPPSPPYSNPSSPSPKLENNYNFVVPRTRSHQLSLSETAITSERQETWDLTPDTNADTLRTCTPIAPRTPTLVNDDASQSEDTWPDIETPSPLTQLRRRHAISRRSSQSPLPSPAKNRYSPSCQLSGHHLTTAILQKTCSLLLGPPVQLVALMLNIASKIAKGTFRGAAYGYGESGHRIPCSWNFSDSEDDTDPSWEEDDYGVSLGRGIGGVKPEPTEKLGGTWEID